MGTFLLNRDIITGYFDSGMRAQSTTEQGRALEDLAEYVFCSIPGVSLYKRNRMNVFATGEMDVTLWNDKHSNGLPFLPWVLFIECKNWNSKVGNQEVTNFKSRLQDRSVEYGILIAANGITGESHQLTAAHQVISNGLRDGIHILVITNKDIEALTNSDDVVDLLKEKICQLKLHSTTMLEIN